MIVQVSGESGGGMFQAAALRPVRLIGENSPGYGSKLPMPSARRKAFSLIRLASAMQPETPRHRWPVRSLFMRLVVSG